MEYKRIQLHPWPGTQASAPPLAVEDVSTAPPPEMVPSTSETLVSLAKIVQETKANDGPLTLTPAKIPRWSAWFGVVWPCIVFSLGGAISVSYFAWDALPGYSVIIGCVWAAIVWTIGYWGYLRRLWDVGDLQNSERCIAKRAEWAITLYRWNYACAVAHVTLSVVIAYLIGDNAWPVRASINTYAWKPVNATDALLNRSCSDNDVVCKVTVGGGELGFLHAEWIVFSFHMLSGLGHTFVCYNMLYSKIRLLFPYTPLFRTDTLLRFLNTNCAYMQNLDRKMNPWRWIEYFFSASLMQVVIMVLTGFTNVWMLVLSASCIAVTQAFGYTAEWQVSMYTKCNQTFTSSSLWKWAIGDVVVCAVFAAAFWSDTSARYAFIALTGVSLVAVMAFAVARTKIDMQKWVFYFLGWFAFFGPWLAVYYTFYDSINIASQSNGTASKPPDWVKVIIWSLVILFACFAVVMAWYLKHWKLPFVSYWSEMGYLILSLVAKASLAFQLWYGLVQRENRGLEPPRPFNVTDACNTITAG